MKITGFVFILILCFVGVADAQSRQDKRTIAFMNAFTRHVTHHNKRHTECIHTTNIAQQHLRLWQDWNKTHHWPPLSWRDYSTTKKGKANASSVVRVSWYNYGDSTSEIEADNNGRVGRFGARYGEGPYESDAFYLKPKQMNEMQRLLRQLPASRKVLKWSDVLLISGRKNGCWFVRMYSRTYKPKVVRQILQMMTPKTLPKRLQA